MPTKTEQADLLQALFGRNGEAPMPVLAPRSPSDCFEMAFEAGRLATKYMVPVILLSDGYIANGSEPWMLPELGRGAAGLRRSEFRTDPRASSRTSATRRRWRARGCIPGTPGLEHRIGGLEKDEG